MFNYSCQRSFTSSVHSALQVMHMTASALRYRPRGNRNVQLRQQIVALAQRRSRYGADIIYLKLRQSCQFINHKRERHYALEKLQVRRRRRKNIPLADRQPCRQLSASQSVTGIDAGRTST